MYANLIHNEKQKKIHFKAKFTNSELQLLKASGISKTFSKREFIYYEQTSTSKVFLLEGGLVKIGTFTNNDKEFIKSIVYPNQLLMLRKSLKTRFLLNKSK